MMLPIFSFEFFNKDIRRTIFVRLLFILTLAVPFSSPAENLRGRAEEGEPAAMNELGHQYFYGDREELQNFTLAAYWYHAAAEKGHAEAMFNYAVCIERGLGVKKNPFTAFEWFKKAAEKGLKIARYKVAMTYIRGIHASEKEPENELRPSPELGIWQLQQLAEEGYPSAEIAFVEICLESKNNQKQLAKGIEILKKIMMRENPPAEAYRLLADCKFGGIGMERDISGMFKLLQEAHKRGDSEATGKLAYCYEYGRGVKPDLQKAISFYRIAAKRGNAQSSCKYGEFLLRGQTGKDGKANPVEAVKYFKKAAENGNAAGMTWLGKMYLDGIGVEQSEKKAVNLFFAAAQKGYPHAQYQIGIMFSEGRGNLIRDDAAAFYWFGHAAIGGDPAAARVVAQWYLEGRGVTRSLTKGEKWLEEAARLGDPEAIRMKQKRSRME